MAGKSRKVEFKGHAGWTLRGILHEPQEDDRGALILCHCFTCSRDFKIISWLARELSDLGHWILRFDFAGLNASDGNFEETSLTTNIEDLIRAVEWLGSRGIPVRALAGHSIGGTAAILAASRIAGIESVITMGTSSDASGLSRLLGPDHNKQLHSDGRTTLRIGGRDITLNRSFFEDLYRYSLLETFAQWNKALLVIHGTADRIVQIESGEKMFRHAGQPKSFVAIDQAGHLFTENKSQARTIARFIAGWVQLNRKK